MCKCKDGDSYRCKKNGSVRSVLSRRCSPTGRKTVLSSREICSIFGSSLVQSCSFPNFVSKIPNSNFFNYVNAAQLIVGTKHSYLLNGRRAALKKQLEWRKVSPTSVVSPVASGGGQS